MEKPTVRPPALPPFRFLGVCEACQRPLFENNRVLLRGQRLFCESCGAAARRPQRPAQKRRSFWRWLLS